MEVVKEGAKIEVFCGRGEKCQEKMDTIVSLLSDGATRYVGYFQC